MASGPFSNATGAAGASRANLERWAHGDFVGRYAIRELRPVEVMILVRYREALSGRVLEVGCGAGRVSGFLGAIASEFCGIDISAQMIEYCRSSYPGCRFEVGDMRDLGAFEDGSLDALLAPANVLDALAPHEREPTLAGFRRVLAPGGLLVMSAHNLAFAPSVHSPAGEVLAQLRSGRLRGSLYALRRLPRRLVNRRRMGPLEQRTDDHALLNDDALDYSLLHYYVSPEAQMAQLGAQGFELLGCLDLDGEPLEAGAARPDCPEIHYVAVSPADRPA